MKNIKLLLIIALSSALLNASITLGDALRTRAIGSGGEKIILGDVSDHKKVTSNVPHTTLPPVILPPLSTNLSSTKLQECYNHVKEVVDRAMKANQDNDPSQSIGIVSLDGSKQCQRSHKECAEKAWQRGKKCFVSSHTGMTPEQIANRCNIISSKGAIKCILEENRCSSTSMRAKCKSKYTNVDSEIKDHIENINNDNFINDDEYERKEYIKQYQQDIETTKHRLDRVEARLKAEREKGVEDRYSKQRIKIYQDSIRTLRRELESNKEQLRELGGIERKHIHRDQSDIYRDIEYNRDIYNNQQELKAKQKELTNIRKIIDRFGNDYEAKRLTIKKVNELSKNASLDKLKAIKMAVKKQYYDSWILDQESETVKQQEIAKELGISENRTILIRDTAMTINNTLGMVYGGGVVTTLHGITNNAIDAVYKDKETGLVVSIVKDIVDGYTFKLGGELIDIPYRLYKYYHNGVDVPSSMKVYDIDGNQLTKVKSTEKLYDANGNNINYSFVRRLERYKLWTTTTRDDILNKDVNKKVNGFLDIINNGKDLGELLWKLH